MQTIGEKRACQIEETRRDRLDAARAVMAGVAAEATGRDAGVGEDARPGGDVGGLALASGLHEWFTDDGAHAASGASTGGAFTGRGWWPPMSVLIGLAWEAIRAAPHRRVVWIGARCWPYPLALVHAGPAPDRLLLDRSVFVDPASRAERVWSIELAARCAGAAVVVGDGRGLSMAESRRVQLAAAGVGRRAGVPVLLARATVERREISAARTRWRVAPHALGGVHGNDRDQGWSVDLLRCKGLRASITEGARRWVVRRDHVTGRTTTTRRERAPSDVGLAPAVVDRPRPAPRTRIA